MLFLLFTVALGGVHAGLECFAELLQTPAFLGEDHDVFFVRQDFYCLWMISFLRVSSLHHALADVANGRHGA